MDRIADAIGQRRDTLEDLEVVLQPSDEVVVAVSCGACGPLESSVGLQGRTHATSRRSAGGSAPCRWVSPWRRPPRAGAKVRRSGSARPPSGARRRAPGTRGRAGRGSRRSMRDPESPRPSSADQPEIAAMTSLTAGFGVAGVDEEAMGPRLESIRIPQLRQAAATHRARPVASRPRPDTGRAGSDARPNGAESPTRSINASNAASSPCIARSTSVRSIPHLWPTHQGAGSPSMSTGLSKSFNVGQTERLRRSAGSGRATARAAGRARARPAVSIATVARSSAGPSAPVAAAA